MDVHDHLVIITDRAGLDARPPDRAACVLAGPDDDDLLDALTASLPQHFPVEAALAGRRPTVHVDGDRVAVLTLVADGWESRRRTYLVASDDLLVVVGDPATLDLARHAVAVAPDRPVECLAKVLAWIGRGAESELDAMSDAEGGAELGLSSDRLISVALRREASRRRARLFEWRQLYAAQARLLDDDEPLAEALGDPAARLLRPARGSFQHAAGVADRLYAVLGDLLSEQDALTSQRLTLVSTVFLPLTVTTGFFGMNFDWLVGHIGSLAAFLLLGIVAPVAFVLVSLGVVRRFGV